MARRCGGPRAVPEPPTLIVPWGAGGGTDAVARCIASLMEKALGQTVNVVNRTGGSGVVGHSAIATAPPDGCTIGMITVEITMMHHQKVTELNPASCTPIALVDLDPAGAPRWTFGNAELAGGIPLIPLMIGMFAMSEILRWAVAVTKPVLATGQPFGNVFAGMGRLLRRHPLALLRGSVPGSAAGALPGAGADIAAWMSYAVSKRFSKEPQKFGTGHVEGIVEAGAANNAALGGAWIPALVFGIPGDTITAIAIGVLNLKDTNPGPTPFVHNPQNTHAVFIVFIPAQLLMLPLGWMAIKVAKRTLRIPARLLMALILLFCIVGAFAINNSALGVWVMLAAGVLGFFRERRGFPVAPTILGVVPGTMLEEQFFSSLVKADGTFLAFFERPIAGGLGMVCLLIRLRPVARSLRRRRPAA